MGTVKAAGNLENRSECTRPVMSVSSVREPACGIYEREGESELTSRHQTIEGNTVISNAHLMDDSEGHGHIQQEGAYAQAHLHH